MFTNPSNRVLFHGTSSDFPSFTTKSLAMGCATEPNNRLGVWLTECPYDAANYSEVAGASSSFPGVLVLEVSIDKTEVICCPLNLLVEGDIFDRDDLGVLSDVFQERVQSSGEDFDRGEAFSDARNRYMNQGIDALWVESGETPILAVFDPEKIKICARLTHSEAAQLADLIEGTPRLYGDLRASEIAPHLATILDERVSKPTSSLMRRPG